MLVLALIALGSRVRAASGSAQVSFEQASADLTSPDAKVRLHAVQLLKGAAYPEAAVPLARLLTDAQDDVQLEAIAACPASDTGAYLRGALPEVGAPAMAEREEAA